MNLWIYFGYYFAIENDDEMCNNIWNNIIIITITDKNINVLQLK